MKKLAFISRHVPTQAQIDLALVQGYEIVHVGDRDAFNISIWDSPISRGEFPAVAVVHPQLAMNFLRWGFEVAVFENANRAPEGEKPSFEAVGMYITHPLDHEWAENRYEVRYPNGAYRSGASLSQMREVLENAPRPDGAELVDSYSGEVIDARP